MCVSPTSLKFDLCWISVGVICRSASTGPAGCIFCWGWGWQVNWYQHQYVYKAIKIDLIQTFATNSSTRYGQSMDASLFVIQQLLLLSGSLYWIIMLWCYDASWPLQHFFLLLINFWLTNNINCCTKYYPTTINRKLMNLEVYYR